MKKLSNVVDVQGLATTKNENLSNGSKKKSQRFASSAGRSLKDMTTIVLRYFSRRLS